MAVADAPHGALVAGVAEFEGTAKPMPIEPGDD